MANTATVASSGARSFAKRGNVKSWRKMKTGLKATNNKRSASAQKMIRAIGHFVVGKGSKNNTKKSLGSQVKQAKSWNKAAMSSGKRSRGLKKVKK